MPGLDILRGVAILSVILYHGLYQSSLLSPPSHTIWARLSSLFVFGWLGVFLFFVLSGFLITGILLDSKWERFYWRSFYIKRALRILPAFFVVIFLIKVFEHASWPYVALCTFYLANLAGMLHIGGFQYGVLWSLAVEEQFYLGWPSVVKLGSRRSLVLIALAILVFSPVLRLISFSNVVPFGDIHMTWLISDNLIAGASLAILLRSPQASERLVKRLAWILLCAGVAILATGIPFGILHREKAIGATFQTVPFEFIFSSMLLFSLFLESTSRLTRLARPLMFFGYISYGLYLYHELVFFTFAAILGKMGLLNHWSPAVFLLGFFVEAAIAVMIAYLSKRYFEDYFLGLKSKLLSSLC
jgi:peptidoglycan/LPS O-acetylase OafA/YrhL